MHKITIYFALVISVFKTSLTANELEYGYFSPKIYHTLWPNFCLKHLYQNPLECSEQSVDANKEAYLIFDKCGSAEAYIEQSSLKSLNDFKYFIPEYNEYCHFQFCYKCHRPVIMKAIESEDLIEYYFDYYDTYYDEDNDIYYYFDEDLDKYMKIPFETRINFRCSCFKYWYDLAEDDDDDEYCYAYWYDEEDNDVYDYGEEFADDYWGGCSQNAVPYNYFDYHSKYYHSFLKIHLDYSKENSTCLCYWPYRSKKACNISDIIYKTMDILLKKDEANILQNTILLDNRFQYLKSSTKNGIIKSLFFNSFFYTQYREILLTIAEIAENSFLSDYIVKECLDKTYALIGEIQPTFLDLYTRCINHHPHPKIYYERGMIYSHQGKMYEAMVDIKSLINMTENSDFQNLLTSDLYFREGQFYAELGFYDKAIESLTEAINKDPINKEAYFERAALYFESGNFEESLNDFLLSDFKSASIDKNDFDFAKGLIWGALKGGAESFKEFIPSTLNSLNGMGHGLWALVADPENFSKELVRACRDCITFINETSTTEIIVKLVPELKELVLNWGKLSDQKKGELTGFVIGKYGIDIFMATGSIKAINSYRKLKAANNLFTLEKCTGPSKNLIKISEEAAVRYKQRKQVLKNANLKVQWDKQGKHITNHQNFKNGKSIFTHSDPEKLINKFAGKGFKEGNAIPGKPGYKEVVDFGEIIGYDVCQDSGRKTITTWGRIHYAKDGVHIVPTYPRKVL